MLSLDNRCAMLYLVTCFVQLERVEIGSFTVVCLVTWSCIGSEAEGDPVLIQSSLLLMCKCKLVSIRTA